MESVNVHEAKTHLSKLLERVEAGEEIIIARNGRPIARLTGLAKPKRAPGSLKGRITMRSDFNDPLPKEIEDSFYESKLFP
ncbi:MAG TPA: type II toxin-antitoxin system Phd/YefM family antitoxin [Chloroflexota bacterium]|jgi:prevent-host-death family protein|nr:type II toxin-antitoxin system Phd/YefM family antitoxin [Chloroflexota bacterium]